MTDALKKLDKKFLIIAGSIILIPLFVIIFLVIMQSCGVKKITYDKYEEKLVSAAEKYLTKEGGAPSNEAELVTISLSTLVDGKYIKSTEKLLGDSTCNGSVDVRRNGSSIETNNGGFLNYTVNLKCSEYSTTHLVDKLLEDVVTEGSGLYKINDEYIFKGDKVNNYITFFGNNYRIMSIDENNIIKLVKESTEGTFKIWDNKFNSDASASYGKNIYKDSDILESLISEYKNSKKISKSAKKHVVAYDSCVGKRNIGDYSINKELDCSEILEKQVISLINVSDYAMASTDPDCKDANSKSCRNYNYLHHVASSTWTMNAVSNNSYEVYYMSNGLIAHDNANTYNEYNLVIYIDGNELYQEGKGTQNNPYILK